LGGGIVVYVAYKFIHRQLVLRELRMARITVDELKQLMDAEAPIVILDVRQAVADDEAPAIPGALRMSLEELDRRHQEIPRDHDVVVYCACPNEASAARMAILLRRHGIKRVRPLLGGIDAWVALRDVRARQASETETRAIA
ncbi:MAG TPA: thiosulfate sulfurtransferase GlpE, partial [Nitrospirales bacterium]|nr:thiosulfate sulfurtransferase GlpE [Nitrospirales bacterium]